MFYQEKPGIYVYYVDRSNWNVKLITRYFKTTNDLFRWFSEWQLATFGDFERIYHSVDRFSMSARRPLYFYAAYDESGGLFTPDRLVGLYRKWRKLRDHGPTVYHRLGRKKRAWGLCRQPKIIQELRMCFIDPDADELGFAVKMRTRREATNIPEPWDMWDERHCHNDKNWKTQSKRIHQWK